MARTKNPRLCGLRDGKSQPRASSKARETFKALAGSARGRQWVRIAGVGVAATLLSIGGLLSGAGILPGRHEESVVAKNDREAAASMGNGVLFAIPAVGAKAVSVVGSFSEWEPVALSDGDGDGVWTAVISLAAGRYEYAYVVDDRWLAQDPLADEQIRSFGGYNSVRYVKGRNGA